MKYVIQKSEQIGGKPPVLVIMHGYGADEYDLISIASHLPRRLLVISLQAPIPLSWGGYSWYHLSQTATGLHGDNPSRHESEELIVKELAGTIEKNGGDQKNVYLLGFSQGSAMCYSLIGRQNLEDVGIIIKGIAALSGYIPADVIPFIEKKDLSSIPFFLAHGEHDDLIPREAMQQAERVLTAKNAKVTAKLYEVGHGITDDTISDLNTWFRQYV